MNRIKELRKEKGETQLDLAKLLNVSDRSVGFYENGKRDPDTTSLKILANHFDVSIDYLLGNSNVRKHQSSISNAFNTISTDGLDESDIEVIKAMIKKLRDANNK